MGARRAVTLPLVTALVTAYEAERFVGEAVDAALAQDYPADRLEVVVVDDGSTDATAAILADRAARDARVRVVRQANAGYTAATSTGVLAAGGELIALLDADDVWPPAKLSRQVPALLAAGAGLLYGDMEVIDEHGTVIDPSWLGADAPPEGRDWVGLLAGNAATSSSVLVRAELAKAWCPIPDDVAFADWYLAVRAAQEAGVVFLREPRTGYRYHGRNMSLGTEGAARADQLERSLALQRWFLRRAEPGAPASAVQLLAAHGHFTAFARERLAVVEDAFPRPLAVTDADREQARYLAARGDAAGAVAAVASDPWLPEARAALAALTRPTT